MRKTGFTMEPQSRTQLKSEPQNNSDITVVCEVEVGEPLRKLLEKHLCYLDDWLDKWF